jgi:hypothetical protein
MIHFTPNIKGVVRVLLKLCHFFNSFRMMVLMSLSAGHFWLSLRKLESLCQKYAHPLTLMHTL